MVIVIANLRPRELPAKSGFHSHGMVLCAETEDRKTVELLQPPAGAKPGDTISFDGYPREPVMQPPKKNPWELVGPRLVIDENGVACYKDKDDNLKPFMCNDGVVKSKTLKNAIIK